MPTAFTVSTRAASPSVGHAAIFGALDALNAGEVMRFVNDHDPIPLLQQMQARYGAGRDRGSPARAGRRDDRLHQALKIFTQARFTMRCALAPCCWRFRLPAWRTRRCRRCGTPSPITPAALPQRHDAL